MNKNIAAKLQELFSGLRFFTVKTVIGNPKDIFYVSRDGTTHWHDEPKFDEEFRFNLKPRDEIGYLHFFGFTADNIYFQKNGYGDHSFGGIKCHPKNYDGSQLPESDNLFMGIIGNGRQPGQKKLRWWVPVHRAYKQLIEICLNPKEWMGKEESMKLLLELNPLEVETHGVKMDLEYYYLLAKILIFERYEELAHRHQREPKLHIDRLIWTIARELDVQDPWIEFRSICMQEKIPSEYIPITEQMPATTTQLNSLAEAFKQAS